MKLKTKIAAYISIAAAVAFLVLLALLHFLKPEIDPSWRLISEYQIGDYGWLMQVAFISLSISIFALALAMRRQVRSRVGFIWFVLLGAAIFAAGLFVTAPGVETELTTTETIHNLCGAFVIMTFPIAATLLARKLDKRLPYKKQIKWATALTWLGLASFLATFIAMRSEEGSGLGPDVLVGWPNRLLIVTYAVWIIAVAWSVRTQKLAKNR